jgi:dTDP-4-dehydro-6-deoxy-alpha-D-glucopyranose 2,3-dehydratase
LIADQENIDWLRRRLNASLAIEPKDPAELIDWLEARRKQVVFSAELIPLREVANWFQADNGNIHNATGQFFRIEGVRVRSAPGVREIAGWDQPIFTQSEGGILALLCRETSASGVEFLLQAKADPGNVGYLQFCPTIQSTWENIRGLKGARRAAFAEYLDPSENIRIIYRSKHNEEGSRFWQKSNENMILFVEDASQLTFNELSYRWASLSQIKQMMLLDNIIGPYVRTVVAAL